MKNNLLIITLFIISFGYSQESEYSWMRITDDARNYHNIIESYQYWLDSVYVDTIPSAKIANVKDFYRFTNFWNARLGNDSTGMLNYETYYKAATAVYQDPVCDNSDPAEWELVGPGYSTEYQNLGLVDEVLFNPQVQNDYLLSTNHGGIWKYDSSDSSWQNTTDAMRLPGVAASEIFRDPSDTSNQHIIASTATGEWGTNYGFGIIESLDNGDTWQVMEGFPNDNFTKVNRVIYDPYDTDYTDGLTLYAITDEHLYKSTNTGLAWTEINAPILDSGIVHNEYIDIEIADNGALFLTTFHKYGINGQVFKFHNNVWKDLNEDKINFDSLQRARITKPYHDTIFLLCDRRDDIDTTIQIRYFYKSTNYGESWQLLHKGNTVDKNVATGGKNEIEYSPLSNIIYTGSIALGILRNSSNVSIQSTYPGHADIRDIELMGIDTIISGSDTAMFEKMLIATDGGITLFKFRITQHLPFPNFNVSEENLNGDHLPIGNFIGIAVNNSSGEIVAGGAVHCWTHVLHNNLWKNNDEGDGGDCEINWIDPSIYYVQRNRYMYKRIIGYPDTTNIYKGENIADWFIGMKYELNPNNPYILYAGRPNELIIYNDVIDETIVKPTPQELTKVGAIGINNKNYIYISNFEGFHPEYDQSGVPYLVNNQFAKSIDNGNTWIDLSQKLVNSTDEIREILNWTQILDILFNPNDPDEMWISVGGIKHDSYGTGTYSGKLRVLHSTDAGESWIDYSDGLTALPCIALEYHMGSNNRLFAGTDAGVYYREPGMSQWECFMDGMPVGIITDLDYDPCSDYLYASMDSRAIWKTPIPFSNPPLLLPDTITTWDYTMRINSNVTIPDGAELMITSNIYMAEATKIMVERGGKLTIDGGLITSTCGGHWKGIEVWGNPNQSQTYANQGAVIIINDGTIENALCGVQSIKWSIPAGAETEQPDYAYSGGIIITSGANFINNRIAIKFWDYDFAPSASFIKNTNFETNDNMLPGTDPETYIIIDEIDGVDIYAGNFTDDHTVTTPNDLMTGIETFNATFKVTSYTGTPSYFSRLKDGIRALVRDPLKTPEITKNQFSNNLRSLYISSVSGAEVTDNDFIYWDGIVPTGESSYCMYLDYCTEFIVEENDFFFNQQLLQDPTGIGLIINYSGPNNNEIYNNTFTNLEYGTLTQGNNRGVLNEIGLKILCNDYWENYQDIAVTAEDEILPGIAKNQGAPGGTTEDQAGNLFSQNNNANDISDYSTFKLGPINYYHHKTDLEPRVEPVYISKYITPEEQNNDYYEELSCPSNESGGGGSSEEGLKSQMAENGFKADSTQAILTALVDGGNTEILENEVLQSMPPETYNIYMSLMGKSPYLSDSVIIAAIEKEDVLPNVLIKDIMVANPQSAKSSSVMEKVDEKSVPFDEQLLAEILLGQYIVAAKEKLESHHANYKHKRSTALKFLKQLYRNDTTNLWAHDSLISLLENETGLNEKYELVFEYINMDNWTVANNQLGSLPVIYSMNLQQQQIYQDMQQLTGVLLNLYQMDSTIYNMPEAQKTILYSLADNSLNLPGSMARNILIEVEGYEYQEPVILPDASLKSGNIVFDLPDIKTFIPEHVKIYPNPAQDYIIVELNTGNATGATISLFDSKGKLLRSVNIPAQKQDYVLGLKDVPTGVYIVKVACDGKILGSKKVNVVK